MLKNKTQIKLKKKMKFYRSQGLATGDWRLATGDWRLATGHRRLATGDWPPATGNWHKRKKLNN